MRKITVSVSIEYDVLIGSGMLKDCGRHVKEKVKPCKAAVISDDRVDSLYGNLTAASLMEAGFDVCSFTFPRGEASKNLTVLGEILEFLAEREFTRSDLIVALGGGVTGDLAGFAAAIYLRGIPLVQIPTTFLSAIDSSVGGKTAVDLKAGKNLAGAFYQPTLVICDPDILKTLDEDVFRDGVAEALKYGLIGDMALFEKVAAGDCREDLEEIIIRCISMKRDIVMEDEFDTGQRQLLNLGHTLGHSIETLSDFRLTHGYAVAIGMYLITKAAYQSGVAQEDFSETIKTALINNGLPYSCEFSAREIAKGTLMDKKRRGGVINFVFPQQIGHCVIRPVPVGKVLPLIEAAMQD